MADEEAPSSSLLNLKLSIPFNSSSEAQIAHNSLKVDAEPKRGGVRKEISVCNNVMHVTLSCKEARTLRVSANSFFEHLILVTKTIQEFGPPLQTSR